MSGQAVTKNVAFISGFQFETERRKHIRLCERRDATVRQVRRSTVSRWQFLGLYDDLLVFDVLCICRGAACKQMNRYARRG